MKTVLFVTSQAIL